MELQLDTIASRVFLVDTHSKRNKFETLYLAYVRVKGKIEKEISKSIIIF